MDFGFVQFAHSKYSKLPTECGHEMISNMASLPPLLKHQHINGETNIAITALRIIYIHIANI